MYVADYGSESVSQYARDAETGRLSALSPATVAAGSEPHSVVVSADDKNVYVANARSNSISQYARDPATGALTPLSPASVAAGGEPRSVAVSPDGRNGYVANTGETDGSETAVSQYARNPQTGALTELSPGTVQAGLNPRFVVVSPDGKSVYVASYTAESVVGFARNAKTGALTGQAVYPTLGKPFSIAVAPDGENVYIADYSTGAISQFARNIDTGLLTALDPPTVIAGEEAHSVVVSPDGASVYVANGTPSGTVSQYYRNLMTGALTVLGGNQLEVGTEPTSIALSPDGRNAYVTNHRSTTVAQYERAPLRESRPGVILTNVLSRGDRVKVEGTASASLIGRSVAIVLNNSARVGLAKVGLDGLFSTTTSQPRFSARDGANPRYVAQIGKLRSSPITLRRRLSISPSIGARGRTILSGRVVPPLGKPVAPIVVWQRVGCATPTAVGKIKPDATGRYSITLTAATTAFYRTTTSLRHATGRHTIFKTYSLEVPVRVR